MDNQAQTAAELLDLINEVIQEDQGVLFHVVGREHLHERQLNHQWGTPQLDLGGKDGVPAKTTRLYAAKGGVTGQLLLVVGLTPISALAAGRVGVFGGPEDNHLRPPSNTEDPGRHWMRLTDVVYLGDRPILYGRDKSPAYLSTRGKDHTALLGRSEPWKRDVLPQVRQALEEIAQGQQP